MIASIISDIRALRASWASVRGGWGAARSDARQLIAHRRVMVETPAMTRDGMQTVLRTRLRLTGDTQTDVLRVWIDNAAPQTVESTAQIHFQSVAAALGGFAAARGMERLAKLLAILIGSLASVILTVHAMLASEPSQWPRLLLTHWWLLSGLAFALLAVVVRWGLRLRLRAVFRGGLTAR